MQKTLHFFAGFPTYLALIVIFTGAKTIALTLVECKETATSSPQASMGICMSSIGANFLTNLTDFDSFGRQQHHCHIRQYSPHSVDT